MIEVRDANFAFSFEPEFDSEKNGNWFYIDTEKYEAQSVKITVLPKKVKICCPASL